MKTTMKFLSYVLALVVLQFVSCEDGEDGAIGPQGPQGEQGIPGMDGMDGQDFNANAVTSTADIINPILGEIMGSSTLVRWEDGLTVEFETSGLIPGYAYTLWWVAINAPKNCGETPCALPDVGNPETKVDILFASGLVADDSGNATFSASLMENDGSSSVNDIVGLPIDVGGLLDVQNAEIHIALRNHGPAIPGMVSEQISSYTGGCTDFLPPFQEIPDTEGECGDTQISIHIASN